MRARVGRCGRHSWDVAPRGAPVFGGYICLDRALSSMGKIRRRHRVQAHRASWRRTDVVFARHPHNTTRGQGHKALSVDAAMAQALGQRIRLRKLTRCGPVRAASHPPPPTPGPPRSFAISTTVSTASRRSIARRCAGAYCRQRRNAKKPSAGCFDDRVDLGKKGAPARRSSTNSADLAASIAWLLADRRTQDYV